MYLIEPEADALRWAIRRALEAEADNQQSPVIDFDLQALNSTVTHLSHLKAVCEQIGFRSEEAIVSTELNRARVRLVSMRLARRQVLRAMIDGLRDKKVNPAGLAEGYSGDLQGDLDRTIMTLEAELRQVA